MATVKLSSPWVKLYREIEAMFKEDSEVKVVLDEENYKIKVYTGNVRKNKALAILLNAERIYGNITVSVIVPDVNDDADGVLDFGSTKELYEAAFENNPALSYVLSGNMPILGNFNYVVFKNKVVQYFNDDLSDVNGNCSTLYQEIAKNIFVQTDLAKAYYCTDTAENLGKPFHEWP